MSITKLLKLYYDPEVLSEDGDKNSTKEKEAQKQEKEIGVKPKLESENKIENTLQRKKEEKINMNETNKPQIKKASHEVYKPHKESVKRNPEDNKMKNLGIGTEREETFNMIVLEKNRNLAPNPNQNSANMDCHNKKWLNKEIFSLDSGYKSRIKEDTSKASEIGFETNEQEAFDIKGKRQYEENYNLNDLEKHDSITVQADI
ncbi:3206_t:CDS:2, partial [Gigaspora margarita]